VTCLVCRSSAASPFGFAPGAPLHQRQVRCRSCGLLISDPQADPDQLERYYRDIYFDLLHSDPSDTWERCYRDGELPLIEQLWGTEAPPKGARLVEIGCGYGELLSLLAERGFRVSGCDPAPRAVAHCRSRGLDVQQGSLPNAPFAPAGADVVASLQVVEHVADPRRFLADLVSLVRPGGWVVVATENVWHAQYVWDRFRAMVLHQPPPFRSSTEHTFVFRPRHLVQLLEEAGCRDVTVRAYDRQPAGESLHWWAYKEVFRTVDRLVGEGELLMATARRRE
jgi:2-polyprenyl-3-methyl-5-hydroxy-6-metoxy-1,4-benzoquinol methylase